MIAVGRQATITMFQRRMSPHALSQALETPRWLCDTALQADVPDCQPLQTNQVTTMSSSLAVGKVAALATSFDPTTRVTSIAAWKINYQISNMGCGTARDVPCGSRRVTTVACRSEGGITTVLRTPSQVLPTDWKAYRGTSSSLHDREKFVTSTRLPRTEPGESPPADVVATPCGSLRLTSQALAFRLRKMTRVLSIDLQYQLQPKYCWTQV